MVQKIPLEGIYSIYQGSKGRNMTTLHFSDKNCDFLSIYSLIISIFQKNFAYGAVATFIFKNLFLEKSSISILYEYCDKKRIASPKFDFKTVLNDEKKVVGVMCKVENLI